MQSNNLNNNGLNILTQNHNMMNNFLDMNHSFNLQWILHSRYLPRTLVRFTRDQLTTMTHLTAIPLLTHQVESFQHPIILTHVGINLSEVNEVEAFNTVCFSEQTLLALMFYDFYQMSWEDATSRALGEVIMDNRLDTPVIRICWGTSAITYIAIHERCLTGPRIGSGMTPFHNQLYWLP